MHPAIGCADAFRRQRVWLPLLLTALAAVLSWLGGVPAVDRLIYDQALRLVRNSVNDDIVVLAIDEHSLQAIGRWPWSRRIHAELLDDLTVVGVRAVGMDIIFAEPENRDPEADELLTSAIHRNGRVVLPVVPEALDAGLTATLPLPSMANAAAALGHVSVTVDGDGVARTLYLEGGLGRFHWRAFPLALLQVGGEIVRGLTAEPEPADATDPPGVWVAHHPVMIAYTDPGAHFPTISYVDVLRDPAKRAGLKDKWIIVSPTATGLGARFATPVSAESQPMNGAELNAQILNALLAGHLIRPIPGWINIMLSAMLVFGVAAIGYRMEHSGESILLLVGAMAATGLIVLALLQAYQWWFAPSAVIVVLTAYYLVWIWGRLQRVAHSLIKVQRRALATLNSLGDAVIVTDSGGLVRYLNPVAEQLTGFASGEASSLNVDDVLTGLSGQVFDTQRPSQWLRIGGAVSNPCFLVAREGQEYTVRVSANPIRDTDSDEGLMMMILGDITSAVQISRRWKYLATHDGLTGLPNRESFSEKLAEGLKTATVMECPMAICLIALEGLKEINETQGHHECDSLLQQAAMRLSSSVRPLDTVARLRGGEFVVLLERLPNDKAAEKLARECLMALKRPFELNGHTVSVVPAIGVSLFPRDGGTTHSLLRNADAALVQARSLGANSVSFYSRTVDRRETLPVEIIHPHENSEDDATLSSEDQAKLEAIRRMSAEARRRDPSQKPSRREGPWLKRWLDALVKR